MSLYPILKLCTQPWTGGDGGGVSSIVAGANVSISPTDGLGDVTVNVSDSTGVSSIQAGTGINVSSPTGIVTISNTSVPPVTRLVQGNNVTLSPPNGLGNVTVNCTPPVVSLAAGAGITISPSSGVNPTGPITISAATGSSPTFVDHSQNTTNTSYSMTKNTTYTFLASSLRTTTFVLPFLSTVNTGDYIGVIFLYGTTAANGGPRVRLQPTSNTGVSTQLASTPSLTGNQILYMVIYKNYPGDAAGTGRWFYGWNNLAENFNYIAVSS